MKILLLHELIFSLSISFYVKGGPGAVVETLHLWPASLQYFKKKLQWQGCLGIPFPRSHLMWKLSALGMPFCYQLLCDICLTSIWYLLSIVNMFFMLIFGSHSFVSVFHCLQLFCRPIGFSEFPKR